MSPINKLADVPDPLKTYISHGVDLNYKKGVPEALGTCPFCGRDNKFSVKVETGQWRCLVCSEGPDKDTPIKGGNAVVFLRTFYRLCKEAMVTKEDEVNKLTASRGFLSGKSIESWGLVKSITKNEWIVPGYNPEGALCQLYRYVKLGDKFKLLATPPSPSLQHQIHGLNLWGKSKEVVFLCEGPWDAMALWEVLSQAKATENGLGPTGSVKASLYNEVNIVAVPGCNTFKPQWCKLFAGKRVVVFFDNDYPKLNEKTGKVIPPASIEGLRRVCDILSSSETPPASIEFLKWGESNYSETLPSGMDLRDIFINAGRLLGSRIKALGEILGKVSPVPSEWLKSNAGASKSNVRESQCTPCTSYKEMTLAWRKAMKWTEGLDCALSVMLASVTSVRLVGDQLWVKIIGPASCGKTSVAKALGMAGDYVLCEDVIRGFTSGWRAEAGEDTKGYDLATRVKNKTMITMDGDTLMQSPNLSNILGEARRLYDGQLSSHFKNGMGKAVDQHRFTWIICGTSSLRGMDASELGERFLDCVVMEGIDDDLEDEILIRVANRTIRNMSMEVSDRQGSMEDPEMETVMRMTGGYVEWLRTNAVVEMTQVETSPEALHFCTRLGKFVAFMRARPSSIQDETGEREFAARLVSQHLRLATCLAVVMNKKSVDKEILARTQKVAFDTARGKTVEITRHLYEAGETGLEVKSIALFTNNTDAEVRKLLRFLKQIGVTENFIRKAAKGISGKPAWTLTPKMKKLWREVHQLE